VTPTHPVDQPLIEAVTSAFRREDAGGGVRFHPAWYDLDAAGRREAFDAVARARRLEAALDPAGLSTTGRAVLARIRRAAP
jgi:hypothetical protein